MTTTFLQSRQNLATQFATRLSENLQALAGAERAGIILAVQECKRGMIEIDDIMVIWRQLDEDTTKITIIGD